MPIVLTDNQREALRRNAIAVRMLCDFWFDSGRYSFWDGGAHWSVDDTTYYATGDFAEASSVSLGQDLGAEGITIKLNGTRMLEAGLLRTQDPGAFFGTIEDETYQLRPMTMSYAFFDMRTRQFLMTVPRFDGLVDQIRQVEEINEGSGEIESFLVIAAESVARRYSLRGGRTRSRDDHREIWPDDEFFDYTAQTTAKGGSLWWGRKPPGFGIYSDIPGDYRNVGKVQDVN